MCQFWLKHEKNSVEKAIKRTLEKKSKFIICLYFQEHEVSPPGGAVTSDLRVTMAIRAWYEYQDGQQILLQTPSVLIGYRMKVYRAEGTTQWYTAVIKSYNENTRVRYGSYCLIMKTRGVRYASYCLIMKTRGYVMLHIVL